MRWSAALLTLSTSLGACYSYTPVRSAPSSGSVVSFSLTDAGRVSLGSRIGAGARHIEGLVESVADTGYTLQVRSVSYVNGQANTWNGERVAVRPEDVTFPRERRFSKRRTLLVAGATVGGLVAFITSRKLLGLGSESAGGKEEPPAEH